jgi:hypothetical protein
MPKHTNNKSKAAKPKTTKKATNASVGPIAGTLETKPDAPKVATPAPRDRKARDAAEQKVNEQFNAIEKTLLDTNKDKKQPRQLRWALRSLDAAKDAALRHIKHNA